MTPRSDSQVRLTGRRWRSTLSVDVEPLNGHVEMQITLITAVEMRISYACLARKKPETDGVELANWNSSILDIITFFNLCQCQGALAEPSRAESGGDLPTSRRFTPFDIYYYCYQRFSSYSN